MLGSRFCAAGSWLSYHDGQKQMLLPQTCTFQTVTVLKELFLPLVGLTVQAFS